MTAPGPGASRGGCATRVGRAALSVPLLVVLLLLSLAGDAACELGIRGDAQGPVGAVQADLVFPVNGSVYQAIFPFPVVFAIMNASAVWRFSRFSLSWKMETFAYEGDGGRRYLDLGSGGFDDSISHQKSAPPPSPYLLINSSDEIGLTVMRNATTLTEVVLWYSITVLDNCTATSWPLEEPGLSADSRYITFHVTRDGEIPDISRVGRCPRAEQSVALEVLGERSAEEFRATEGFDPFWAWESIGSKSCPIMREPRPAPKDCAFTIGDTATGRVREAMLSTARCSTGTWPPPTGQVRPCPSPASTLRFQWAMLWWAWAWAWAAAAAATVWLGAC